MSLQSIQARCPDCGFLIHNRAYPKCERCGKSLPSALVLSKEEKDREWQAMVAARAAERKAVEDAKRFGDTSSNSTFLP